MFVAGRCLGLCWVVVRISLVFKAAGVLLLCAIAFGLVVPLLSSENKWPTVLVLFGIYTGLSGVNDNLLQAATTAPMAGLISVWLIHRGRKPLGPGTQGQQRYTLEQNHCCRAHWMGTMCVSLPMAKLEVGKPSP